MRQGYRRWVWVVALLASMCVYALADAQPAPIAESFARHRSVLSCPGAGSAHDYEQCAFEFMRRSACDNQSLVALWPKTGGTFCTHGGRGYDCDKLVVRASGEMFDVVVSAGAPSQSPSWNRVATGVFSGTVPAPSCASPPPPPPPPTPAITVDEALRRLNERWQARFGRDVHPTFELPVIVAYALTKWNGIGDVPVWLIDDIIALSDQYDGSLVPTPPVPIAPSARLAFSSPELTLDGEPFEWLGQSCFLIQYEWFDSPSRYVAARNGLVAAGVTGCRVGVAVGTGYLQLKPRSGGTFGSGRTWPLHPGNTPDFWSRYRAMLADLSAHGIVAEVVPFLTVGPYNPHGSGGGRPNTDTSVPHMLTAAARLAYVEEAARELLPVRAALVEIANEYLFIGFAADGHEVTQLALAYQAIDPERSLATSAFHPVIGDYRTMHMERMTTPRSWSWVINQLRYPRPDVHTINDEGINADTVGEFGHDPTPSNHWANGALHRLVPALSYTFHFDRALKGLPPSAVDGSLQAITAWRDGTRVVPADVSGQYLAVPNVLGADVAVARLGDAEGWVLLIGSTGAPVDVPEWDEALVGAQGPHRLYRLTR